MTAEVAAIPRRWSRPWWESLTDLSFMGIFIWGALPETIVGKGYIGPVPLAFLIGYTGLGAMWLEQVLSTHRDRLLPKVGLLIGILLALSGLWQGAGARWIVIDLSTFLGLIAGIEWVNRRSMAQIFALIRRSMGLITLICLLTLIGLKAGVVPPARESGRLYVYSLFRCGSMLAIMLPLVWVSRKELPLKRLPEWTFHLIFLSGYLLIFGISWVTGTRSVLFGGVLSLLLYLRLLFRTRGHLFLLSLVLIGTLIYSADSAGVFPRPDLGELGQRLEELQYYQHGPRYRELEMLFGQMDSSHWIWGMGFGSRYESVVRIGDSYLALSPHVAIFTFLQKGGVPLFLLCIVLPALFLFAKVIAGGRSERDLAIATGALMYLLLSSLSDGWSFLYLFLYGTYLGLLTEGRSTSARRCREACT